jgi:uncharacterized protein
MHPDAKRQIEAFKLLPHPEGGYYREVIRSQRPIEMPVQGSRKALTSIYFLLCRSEVSRWHRVASDEVWIWLDGSPLDLHVSDLSGYAVETLQTSNRQWMVPSGHWQAARTQGDYSLMACVVAPGFEFADFELIRPDTQAGSGVAKQLIALRPEAQAFV